MYHVIVDLEATCCENNEFARNKMEIIEIGAVILDESGVQVGTFQSFVQPVYNPTLTDFCKNLTGINQLDVNGAKKFSDVMNDFYLWVENETDMNFILESWGDFDKNILNREMYEKLPERQLRRCLRLTALHTNLKEKFAHDNKCKPMGVGRALSKLGLTFIGNHHRALDDALNIKRIAYGE